MHPTMDDQLIVYRLLNQWQRSEPRWSPRGFIDRLAGALGVDLSSAPSPSTDS